MNIEKNLSHLEFLNREYRTFHLPYDQEMLFFQSVKQGNAAEAYRLFKPFDSREMGSLSTDPLRNLKYHLIITIAMLTRYCIEGGMEMEIAYTLSDIYIRNADECRTEKEIHHLHREVVDEFIGRMQLLHKPHLYSKQVTACLDYIYDNLHNRITLEELAAVADLSPSYLSRLFHKEVGTTISRYITSKRIDAAENMLKFSEYSFVDISNYLCFSSESHFIHTFKKHTGYTPRAYRELFFRTHWNAG